MLDLCHFNLFRGCESLLTRFPFFEQLVDEDDYSPMMVENQDEYNLLQKSFRFKEDRQAARRGYVIALHDLPTRTEGYRLTVKFALVCNIDSPARFHSPKLCHTVARIFESLSASFTSSWKDSTRSRMRWTNLSRKAWILC